MAYSSDDDDDILSFSNKIDVVFGKPISKTALITDSESDSDSVNPVMNRLRAELGTSIDDDDDDDSIHFLGETTPAKQRRMMLARGRSPTPPSSPEMTKIKVKSRGAKTKQKLSRTAAILRQLDAASSMSQSLDSLDSLPISPVRNNIDIKIRIHGCIQKRSIGKDESFAAMISNIATSEHATHGQVCLDFNDYQIKPTDTPNGLGITVADILECLILKEIIRASSASSSFTLKIQSVEKNSVKEYPIAQNSPLGSIITVYCKDTNVDRKKCTFYFDGFIVRDENTPNDIDADDGDVIDVRLNK